MANHFMCLLFVIKEELLGCKFPIYQKYLTRGFEEQITTF